MQAVEFEMGEPHLLPHMYHYELVSLSDFTQVYFEMFSSF